MIATTVQMTKTAIVYIIVSLRVGQVIFLISDQAPPKKLVILLEDFIVVGYQKEAEMSINT